MTKKHYTIDEANAALSEVKKTAARIKEMEDVRQEKQKAHTEIMVAVASNGGDISESYISRLEKELDRATRKLQLLIDQLQNKFQCEIKGLQPLLVDFYSIRDDREVYLCWKEGEEEITHWHDLDAGFSGRRPL